MIRGLHGLFYSSDADATRAFLRDALKLPFTDVGGGWLIFDLPQADVGVHPVDESGKPPPNTHDVSFYCDDIHGTVADLQSRGVQFKAEPADQGYGYVTHFTMPGGIEVQFDERLVTVTPDSSQSVMFDLKRSDTGVLKVDSMVPDAMVFIDRVPIGKVPQEKRLVQGDHLVAVRLEGYKPFERNVRVEVGQTATVQADLKAVGGLLVQSGPDKATVLINGLRAGLTPLYTELDVGQIVVRIELPGFVPFEQTLTIQGGKTKTLFRVLERVP